MSIKIGHASIDENNQARYGTAGDQTGKEVCVRSWYSKPWDFVLRYPDTAIAEKMAAACEAGCANDNIGYDQNQRNSAHTQAKKVGYDLSKITTPCETDCSAFMTLCAIAAGVTALEYTGNAPTTSTMKTTFAAAGFTVLTNSSYLTSDTSLKRGDILVKAGVHTVMALENGSASTSTTSTAASSTTSSQTLAAAKTFDRTKAGTYTVTASALNLRSGGGTNYSILTVLKQGETVHCYGYCSGDWLLVQLTSGLIGYAHSKYLRC